MTTKAEKEHLAAVKQLPCVVCRGWPVHVHHIGTGAGGRRDHMKVIPLCERHHMGEDGIHKIGRRKFAAMYGSEKELLERTQLWLTKQ